MNYKLPVVLAMFLICLVLTIIVNGLYGIGIVYTHLFYIPIILTALWYPRTAVFLAASLGLFHIACGYAAQDTFKAESFLRAVVFMLVAYVTGYLALKRDRLFNELRTINSAMLDMISKIDNRGIIRYMSPSVATVLGYTQEEVTGKPFSNFLHPDEASAVQLKLQKAMETRASFRMDYRYRRADGKYIWIESLANPLNSDREGMNVCVLGSRDITLRKQAEENLRHLSTHDALTGLHNRTHVRGGTAAVWHREVRSRRHRDVRSGWTQTHQ